MKVDCVKRITITNEKIVNIRKFAQDMVRTVDYSDSRQTDKNIIEKNIFIGKIGEESAYLHFQELGYVVKGPDYNIYDSKEKRWKCDLIIEDTENNKGQLLEIHVMTQASSVAKYHGINWIIQAIDSGRKDPILDNSESLICLVECDDSTYGTYPCIIHGPYKIGDIKLSDADGKYKGIKKVIKKYNLPGYDNTKIETVQKTDIMAGWE